MFLHWKKRKIIWGTFAGDVTSAFVIFYTFAVYSNSVKVSKLELGSVWRENNHKLTGFGTCRNLRMFPRRRCGARTILNPIWARTEIFVDNLNALTLWRKALWRSKQQIGSTRSFTAPSLTLLVGGRLQVILTVWFGIRYESVFVARRRGWRRRGSGDAELKSRCARFLRLIIGEWRWT